MRFIGKPVTVMIAVGLVFGLIGVGSVASAADADLNAELAVLKARLAELEAKQDESWLSERRAEEVKTLIHEVLSDADTRASLLSNGLTAGHSGKHFFLASEDGSSLLNVSGQVQFRYIYNGRKDTSPSSLDGDEYGFQLRRVKVFFSGHVGSPRINYSVGLQTDPDTENVELDHGWVSYQLTDNTTVFAGEDKAPFLREELTSSKRQLAVERSLMNEIFTAGRIQGIWVKIEADDNTKLTIALTDGANSGEAGGTKDFHTDDADLALTGRMDMRLAGEWDQAKDFSAWSDQEQAVFVGAAVHYELGETGDSQASAMLPAMSLFNSTMGAIGYDDFLAWTLDGSVESGGLSVFGAITGLRINAIRGGSDVEAYGLVVQGAFMVIPDKFEPFLRWEWIDPDATHQINLVTLGANYYLSGHNAKLTTDLVWALNSLDNASSSGLGLLSDASGKVDQLAIRAQLQLLF